MVWSLVRIHVMNQNAYPAVSEDVLAALPIQATRADRNGNHAAFFKGRAMCSAPPTLPRSVGLWFVGRRRDAVGTLVSRASKVSAESVRKQKQEKPL
jgi:hypothetical protein